MKKIRFVITVILCLLLCACNNTEKISLNTPENVYVTFYSGSDIFNWELSEDEISSWVDWVNKLNVSPINLEESKMLIDYMYNEVEIIN